MRQVKSLFLVLMVMILHHSFGDIDVIDGGGGGGYGVVADLRCIFTTFLHRNIGLRKRRHQLVPVRDIL